MTSPRRPGEGQPRTPTRWRNSDAFLLEEDEAEDAFALHALFSLPHSEALIEDFACAISKSILLQGRMYITQVRRPPPSLPQPPAATPTPPSTARLCPLAPRVVAGLSNRAEGLARNTQSWQPHSAVCGYPYPSP
ncbi:hypothetical protein T492DRAFT_85473 [Pavlovales sp. CCMP2436]|nr:hypothetical protein T492DRAFT_85473 [Pavlovales sp. CCMP2436]